MTQPILSILVITHNQRDLLKRCLDSVLGQKLNVSFEVIVSDDRSEDGTAEYILDLQEQLKNGKRQISNLQELVYTRCNSNDCDPKNVSERCGWNKLNTCYVKIQKPYPTYYGSYYQLDCVKQDRDAILNLFSLVRNGKHRYNNMDYSMMTTFETADSIKSSKIAYESVNLHVNLETKYHGSK